MAEEGKLIHWIIQKTLAGEQSLNELIQAIEKNDNTYELIEVIPFDTQIHYIPKSFKKPVIYGSSTFMFGSLVHPYLKAGVFYHPQTFRMSEYLKYWGEHMLNADAKIIKIKELFNCNDPEDKELFVRPDSDSKSFCGEIYEFSDLKRRFLSLLGENPYLNMETKIMLSSVKEIEKEWRCYMIDGRAVSVSRYRERGRLSIDQKDLPDDFIDFCQKMCKIYQPHPVFVLDIAKYQGKYKIIECNCFNGSGFYQHDVRSIVRAVGDYVIKKL